MTEQPKERRPRGRPPKRRPTLGEILSRCGLEYLTAEIQRFDDTPDEPEPEPVWPNQPLVESIDGLHVLTLRKLPPLHLHAASFYATEDWSRLAVPLSLLPPEVLPDPVLKDWAWADESVAPGSRDRAYGIARKFLDNGTDASVTPRLSKLQARILKTAAKIHAPGELMKMRSLALKLGMAVIDVADQIKKLKLYGDWPFLIDYWFPEIDYGVEADATADVLERLKQLPSADAMRRTINMIIAQHPWDETVDADRTNGEMKTHWVRMIEGAMYWGEPSLSFAYRDVGAMMGLDHAYFRKEICNMRAAGVWPLWMVSTGTIPGMARDQGEKYSPKLRKKPTKKRKKQKKYRGKPRGRIDPTGKRKSWKKK